MIDHSPLAGTLSALDTGVIEQCPTALCVCRAPDGAIIRYNALAVRLWGRTPDPGERMTGAWRTRNPDGRVMATSDSAMETVLSGGVAIRDRQMTIERPDGTRVAVTAFISPLQDDSGRLAGAISSFEEVAVTPLLAEPTSYASIFERHQLLRDTGGSLRGVLDAALIGVWDYDLRTRRAVRSITHDQIHGYPRALGDWTFDTFLDHVAPEDRGVIRGRFEQCLITGEADFDCRIIRPDGSPGWIWSRGRVVTDASGAPARLVGVVMDVTRHRLVEQSLGVERRRRETFVSTLAHELRQPLSALLAAVEVIRLGHDKAAEVQATEVMRRQIGQMNRAVEDLIDATRWARGTVTLRQERLDVRDVIREAALDVSAAIAERGHELVVATASEPLWADADPQRLHQVLSNLLRNAVKYTDPGGRISLAGERGLETMTLRVGDTGRGIDPEAIPHIFDMFTQGRPNESGGLGIGLSVVREIVTLHQGHIEARSAGQGHGSEFIVTLPLAPPPPSHQRAR